METTDPLASTIELPGVIQVKRVLELVSRDWRLLPAFSEFVINDDTALHTLGEDEDCKWTTGEPTPTTAAAAHASSPPERLWALCNIDYTSPPYALQHPSALSHVVLHVDVKRDTPSITVDGAPFDATLHTVPSGYGDLTTCTTKFDSTVRLCSELAARPGVCVAFADAVNNPIAAFLPLVQTTLFPTVPIALRLKKINVYGKGGHFARHVDTPREGVLGTVVLQPTRSDGGDGVGKLVLGTGAYSLEVLDCHYSITAFYSDVPHEVLPGKRSRVPRVTIVYDIVPQGRSGADDVDDVDDADDAHLVVPQMDRRAPSAGRTPSAREQPPPKWLPTVTAARVLGRLPSRLTTDVAMERVRVKLDELRQCLADHQQRKNRARARARSSKRSRCDDGDGRPQPVAVLCTSSYSYDEIRLGVPKASDVVIERHMRAWGCTDLCIVPVLVRHVMETDMDEHVHGAQTVEVVRATKQDLHACIAGEAPAQLAHKHIVLIPAGAGDALHKTFSEEQELIEHTGNEARPGYEDNRYWTCVIAGLLAAGADDSDDVQLDVVDVEDEDVDGDGESSVDSSTV